MDPAVSISFCALVVSVASLGFSWYVFSQGAKAKLIFRMSIGRTYESEKHLETGGKLAFYVSSEKRPSTRLIIRNMSRRPSGIIAIRATNPNGDILSDVNAVSLDAQLPIRLEPWDVKILTNYWAPGPQTEGMYFEIEDVDGTQHVVEDYTNNLRRDVGDRLL